MNTQNLFKYKIDFNIIIFVCFFLNKFIVQGQVQQQLQLCPSCQPW